MSTLSFAHLTISVGAKTIVDDASLFVTGGEIHVLMGPNGSGKSSLLNGIMGHPNYELKGNIVLDGEDITHRRTEDKARMGIFLSLQQSPEISGVTLTNFLFRAHKHMKPADDITPLDFYQLMASRAKEHGIDPSFLAKHLNSGLSGGEKKQSEILQLIALAPKFALLDEIDSGVDIDALKKVFSIITKERERGVGFLLVTHSSNLLSHITPDHVHIMKEGNIVVSGGKELVERVAKDGFENIT